MADSKQIMPKEQQEIEKYFWIITNQKYNLIRSIKGCGDLVDLNATPNDREYIKKFAEKLGVKEENIIHDVDPDHKKISDSYKNLFKATKKLT